MNAVDNTYSTPFGELLREVATERAGLRSAAPCAPLPREMWPRLKSGITPIAGESLRGLVARACHLNYLPNSWGVLKHMALLNRNRVRVAEEPNLDPAHLAHALRVAEEEVVRRRHPASGREHVSFFGLDVPYGHLERRIRHFSPTAFAHDLSKAITPYHRAMWELRDIPFCLDHWDMLQGICWCERKGVVQGWTRTQTRIHECDKCGDPLHRLEPIPIPEDMRPALRLLAALAHTDETARAESSWILPDAIRHAPRSVLFDIVVRMAAAIDPHASEHPIEEPRARLHSLKLACDALTSWPHGISGVIFAPTVTDLTDKAIRKQWAGLSGTACPTSTTLKFKPRNKARAAPNAVGARPATVIAKLSRRVLLWAWDNGHLTRHYRLHGTRQLAAFDPGELVHFGKSWRNRVRPDALAVELGISLHGVEQLVALGIIKAEAPAMPGTGPHFHPEAVDAFIDQIEAARTGAVIEPPTQSGLHLESAEAQSAATSISDPITLFSAMRRIGGRAKPWGPVIALLLDRTLPFNIEPATCLADSIVIPSACFPVLAAAHFDRNDPAFAGFDFADRLIQGDALDLLNAGATDERILEGLDFEGAIPKHYRVKDVERRAAKFVCLPEIAAILRMTPQETVVYMNGTGFVQPILGRWDRKILDQIH